MNVMIPSRCAQRAISYYFRSLLLLSCIPSSPAFHLKHPSVIWRYPFSAFFFVRCTVIRV